MKTTEKLLISGSAVLTLLFSGCTGGYYTGGPYEGPYLGDFGPYYSGYGPYYGGDLVIGGTHYQNHYGEHHFYGRSFGARHFASPRRSGGFHGGGSHPGGGAPHGGHH
jgi:hypothetical protein